VFNLKKNPVSCIAQIRKDGYVNEILQKGDTGKERSTISEQTQGKNS
jgi:hypothetical protein